MKRNQIFLYLILIVASITLSACSRGAIAASSWPGLEIDEDTAYVAHGSFVYAVNLSNGLEKWRFPAEADRNINFYAAPTVTTDGEVIVGGFNNVLYSLDRETGAELWSFSGAKNRFIGGPLAVDGLIFAPNADENLYALDTEGNLQWTFKTSGAQWTTPVTDPDCDCIYLPSMDHRLYAINAQTGSLKWKTDDLGGSIVGRPAYGPTDNIFIGTFASEILALDASNGAIRWRTPTQGWIWDGPIQREDRIYFGDLNGTFYAVDLTTGAIIWTYDLDGPLTESPLLTDDGIYIGTEAGTFFALTYEGNTRWSKPLAGKIYTSPLKSDDLILVASTGGDELLFALDASGNLKWTFIPEK